MIEYSNNQEGYEFDSKAEALIAKAVDAALKFEGFKYNYEISIVITDNAGIKIMNNRFRNIDKETDVLSFPMIEFNNKNLENPIYDISDEEINPETGDVMLGDIVISIEKAYQQAEEYGHSFERELSFLTVHSTLHLLGYDHMIVEDEQVMRKKEEMVLSGINLSRL
ncbi:MAG: ybeY [Clostridiales bacterium]|nr:ybeY [Clostridiales bacterium]